MCCPAMNCLHLKDSWHKLRQTPATLTAGISVCTRLIDGKWMGSVYKLNSVAFCAMRPGEENPKKGKTSKERSSTQGQVAEQWVSRDNGLPWPRCPPVGTTATLTLAVWNKVHMDSLSSQPRWCRESSVPIGLPMAVWYPPPLPPWPFTSSLGCIGAKWTYMDHGVS